MSADALHFEECISTPGAEGNNQVESPRNGEQRATVPGSGRATAVPASVVVVVAAGAAIDDVAVRYDNGRRVVFAVAGRRTAAIFAVVRPLGQVARPVRTFNSRVIHEYVLGILMQMVHMSVKQRNVGEYAD